MLCGVLLLVLASCRPGAKPRDDDYKFTAANGRLITLTLTPSGESMRVRWPATGRWDTALLRVKIRSQVNDGRIRISAGGRTIEQYLDARAKGLRWLNVTDLRDVLGDGASILLTGVGARIDSTESQLRTFDNRLDFSGPILVLTPHPDDAEIAAFGLYAGRNAYVVTLTAGNAGDSLYEAQVKDAGRQYRLKGFLRAIDSVTIPWQGGIPPQQTFNLGYFDGRLREMYERPDAAVPEVYSDNTDIAPYRRANLSSLLGTGSRINSWSNLVADLGALLAKVHPTLIVMPSPLMDWHADHQFTAVALMQALRQTSLEPRFLLFTNHAIGTGDRYPYGPAGTVGSIPPRATPTLIPSVYAHPVSEELQIRKLFAMESMHDLRLSPAEQSQWTSGSSGATRRLGYPRRPAVDFLRRAPRPQEIFYVYDRTEAATMIGEFLRASGRH